MTDLFLKYNRPGPRYTSYPPANYFYNLLDNNDFTHEIRNSNSSEDSNISLYIHIPFCPQLCFFCGCNTMLKTDENIVKQYIDAIKKEIIIFAELIDKTRKLTQIHIGGGTPNSIDIKYITEIMDLIYSNFNIINNTEIAIECNPAYLSLNDIEALKKSNFNRISIGIQDFNPEVLKSINRLPTQIEHHKLFGSVNF